MNVIETLKLLVNIAASGVLISDTISLFTLMKKEKNNKINSKINFEEFNIEEESNLDKIDYNKLGELISYIEILDEKLTSDEKRIMYNNLINLKTEKNKLIVFLGQAGFYLPKENKIKYANEKSIGHELLHMASSSIINEKIYLIGFRYISHEIDIGNGLNEGYTELLASRYFNFKRVPTAYKENVKIAQLMECFFDYPENMRYLYFNHNLEYFVKYMEKFAPREEIIELLIDIDRLQELSQFIMPVSLIKSRDIQDKLNKWFKSKITDKNRIDKFNKIYNEFPNKILDIKKQIKKQRSI